MPQPPRLFFLPGAGADPAFWRPLGERLPAAWSKRYFAWPGLGEQAPDPAVQGLDDLVALVERELGDDPVDLLAQSMGGLVALMVALRNPSKVRRLALSVTSAGIDMAGMGAEDWRPGYFADHPNAASWLRDLRIDLAAQLARVRQPALLLWGDADPISPVAVGERLRSLLPDAGLQVVPGGGHDLVHARAAEVAPLIEAHLA